MINNDLSHKVERLSYYMNKLIKLHNDIVDLTWGGDKGLQEWVCAQPFNRIDIFEGGIVSSCCLYRIKYGSYFGNAFDKSFEEIWNSENAKRHRYAVLKGNFEYCDRICPVLRNPSANPEIMFSRKTFAGGENYKTWHDCSLSTGPSYINICFDRSCNLSCPSCRERVMNNSDENNKKITDLLKKVVRPALKNCIWLKASSSGEFFASKPLFEFYKTLTPEEFPLLKLIIFTNGTLFTPERWNKLHN